MPSMDIHASSGSHESRPYHEGELTRLSLKTVELYQIQGQLVDRIYAYFHQYSALLIIIGFGVALYGRPASSLLTAAGIAVASAYLVFAIGNHRALEKSTDELILLRSIAVSTTRLQFRGSNRGSILRFHVSMIVMTLTIYSICWVIAI